LLPWEIISNDGKLLDQPAFEAVVGDSWQHKSMYPLVEGLWKRARNEIQGADKISFVGLSIASFMEPELRYLFSGKSDIIQAVVANPENKRFKEYSDSFHSRTHCGKLLDVLYKICPRMCCNRSDSEGGQVFSEQHFVSGSTSRDASEVTPRIDFSDFIKHEL
jgi:hypothetical protein